MSARTHANSLSPLTATWRLIRVAVVPVLAFLALNEWTVQPLMDQMLIVADSRIQTVIMTMDFLSLPTPIHDAIIIGTAISTNTLYFSCLVFSRISLFFGALYLALQTACKYWPDEALGLRDAAKFCGVTLWGFTLAGSTTLLLLVQSPAI